MLARYPLGALDPASEAFERYLALKCPLFLDEHAQFRPTDRTARQMLVNFRAGRAAKLGGAIAT